MTTHLIVPLALGLALVAHSVDAQTNTLLEKARPEATPIHSVAVAGVNTNLESKLGMAMRVEGIRAGCISNRRRICGRIVTILPEGLVVESGYTNLMRTPLNKMWLMPATTVADRAMNILEANQPESLCIGLVLLSDFPRSPGPKPHPYDFVNLQAFPMGEFTYRSVGNVYRTVRKFTTKLPKAVDWKLQESEPLKEAK